MSEKTIETALMAEAVQVANRMIKECDARIAELTTKVEIMRPKAEYFDKLVEQNLLTDFKDTAAELRLKEKRLIKFLLNKSYIYRDSKGNLRPYTHMNNGLFVLKEGYDKNKRQGGIQIFITPKGRETFRLLCRGLDCNN